jgi:Eukaryotic glutathione synthase, ATP binding domain
MVDTIARDDQFLSELFDNLSKFDTFTKQIYEIYKETNDLPHRQTVWMGTAALQRNPPIGLYGSLHRRRTSNDQAGRTEHNSLVVLVALISTYKSAHVLCTYSDTWQTVVAIKTRNRFL